MGFDNLKLTTKSMVPLALMATMFVGIVAMSATTMQGISSRYNNMVEMSDPGAINLARFNRYMTEMAYASFRIAAYKCTGEDGDKCKAIVPELQGLTAKAHGVLAEATRQEPALAAEISVITTRFEAILTDLTPAIAQGLADDPAAVANVEKITIEIKSLAVDGVALVDRITAANRQTASELRANAERGQWMMVALGLSAVLLGLGITAWISVTKIGRPLTRLSGVMRTLASGNLTADVHGQKRRDEIGTMAQTVQVFKDAAIDKKRLEQAAEDQKHAIEQEAARVATERQVVATQLADVVENLAGALTALSNGDLTCDIDQPFAPEYERLRTDFNSAVSTLRNTIGIIVANTGAIRSGAGEISQAADDLSRRTEQQAASLEETAAALDEITATVRQTAEGAKTAQAVVATATADAEQSETVVRDAMSAMGAIEKSAQEISQIIGVIDEIAFQTNLLALNAGVEAARAGDAGRGFAVVASEVRALAQRSAEAAKEIKQLISTSTQQVGQGVTLVGDTGKTLTKIRKQVTEINGVITNIAASAQEQAAGLAQVNVAINQMDQVTQQNAAMVEQSTAASSNLAQDAAELERLTAHFNTGIEQLQQPTTARETAPAPKAKAKGNRTPPSSKGLRLVGNAVRKPAADEGWTEF